MSPACSKCLTRAWLLGELSGHLDPVRAKLGPLLSLADEELVAAVGGRRRELLMRRLHDLDAERLRVEAHRAGLELICRCQGAFPPRLRELANAPSMLYVAGGMERFLAIARSEPVALVGSRRASSYGTSVACSVARSLVASGVPVISGMAAGIDSAAHRGALSAGGPTVAVLPGPANAPYPRASEGLYRELLGSGSAVSEIPPGVGLRSWMFLARNRIIAGLAAMTIVVEAGLDSAALLTAGHARELGRPIAGIPGRVTTPQAAGPHSLIRDGAHLVSGAQDVLDVLFDGGRRVALRQDRPALTQEHEAVLVAIDDGYDTPAALVRQGVLAERGLADLAWLELAGYVKRGVGGRFTRLP